MQFVTGNGASFYTDATGIRLSYTVPSVPAQSVQPVAASGSNGSFLFSTLQFVTGNGATFYTDATGIRLSYTVPAPGGGDAIRGIAANGSTASTNTVHFSNSNNISFGWGAAGNSTVLTADVGLAASNSAGSFTFKTLNFSNANNVTFGTSAGSIITASVAAPGGGGFASVVGNGANGTGTFTDKVSFAAGNNVTLSTGASIISIHAPAGGAGGTMQGGYSNLPYFTGTVTLAYGQSTSHVVPFQVGNNLSFDYVRIHGLPAVSGASTTAATAANTTFSVGYTKTHNLALYSIAQGANSNSLQLHVSTQFLEYFSGRIGAGAASANGQVYTFAYTLPCSSGNSAFGYSYSSTAASFNVNSAGITGLTGTKLIDLPFGTSISAGRWFLMYGYSTTTAVQAAGTTIGLRNAISYNPVFMSQAAVSIGVWGAATSNIYGVPLGAGSFTTVGGATTNSLHITKITASAANPLLYFNLMRSA